MSYLKIGNQYVNMDRVEHVAPDERLGVAGVLFLYTSDHTIRITDKDEQAAVLLWLDRNSTNALAQIA